MKKNFPCVSIPGSGRSPGERHGNPLQYSCLQNPKDRGAWWVAVPGVAESDLAELLILSVLMKKKSMHNNSENNDVIRATFIKYLLCSDTIITTLYVLGNVLYKKLYEKHCCFLKPFYIWEHWVTYVFLHFIASDK